MESNRYREPWNKGKLIGRKPPLKPKVIWTIRIYLQNEHQIRYLAMFNLAIDSKLRGFDLVNLKVRDITRGNQILARAMVVQRKPQRPVQCELTEPTRSNPRFIALKLRHARESGNPGAMLRHEITHHSPTVSLFLAEQLDGRTCPPVFSRPAAQPNPGSANLNGVSGKCCGLKPRRHLIPKAELRGG